MSGNYVETDGNGQVLSIVGSANTRIFRTRMLLRGLEFEVKTGGMRLTNKAPKCSTLIKREYGLKGNPVKLLEQFRKLCNENPEMVNYLNPIKREPRT